MFNNSADIYDVLYSFKNYKKEAGKLESMINKEVNDCQRVLDVGCGTAEHHRFFNSSWQVDGLDINDRFLEIAQKKNPGNQYHFADMTGFKLQKRFDVILCLFSTIGYAKTLDKLTSTVKCFRDHLNEGGAIFIEPWFQPNQWNSGDVHMLFHEDDSIKICRMNMSDREGDVSIIDFHYLVGKKNEEVSHFTEKHELALYTEKEMHQAFEQAGLKSRFEEGGLMGRGIYIGK